MKASYLETCNFVSQFQSASEMNALNERKMEVDNVSFGDASGNTENNTQRRGADSSVRSNKVCQLAKQA
jgi:hypothetical protein